MSNAAREDGSNVSHERLAQEVIAEEAGYFYIYLSNDSNTGSEAFFDDFTIMTSESYIVQQTDYYPYGLIAKNWTRVGEKATKDLFQGKTYEDLTKWYDFHARQYDASLGRWFGVDPQNQFHSPYLAMGNNPVMMVDPDGELAWFVPIIIGAVVGGATGGVIAHNNGQDFWGGVLKGAMTGAALTATMGKAGVFGANVKSGMAAYAKAKAGTKLANVASNSFSGALNMVNNYDPDAGVGHMLGNFAAGYIGSYAGIEESYAFGAFFTGGALTSMNDLLHGRIENEYGLAQSFVGGGLSALAGKSFNEVLDKPKYWINKDVFAKYGLQNVASNFAYDRRQEFFKKPLAIHGAAFMVGGVGASLQQGIMGKEFAKTTGSAFASKFLLSTTSYFAEYSTNFYFKTKMQYVKYGDYGTIKAWSFGVKSLAYSWLYSFGQ